MDAADQSQSPASKNADRLSAGASKGLQWLKGRPLVDQAAVVVWPFALVFGLAGGASLGGWLSFALVALLVGALLSRAQPQLAAVFAWGFHLVAPFAVAIALRGVIDGSAAALLGGAVASVLWGLNYRASDSPLRAGDKQPQAHSPATHFTPLEHAPQPEPAYATQPVAQAAEAQVEGAPPQSEGEAPAPTVPSPLSLGRDLTALAREGKLAPAIGRDAEIAQLTQTLLMSRKSNAVIIGEAGVGKTMLVEDLARRIAEGSVPPALQECQVIDLPLSSLISDTENRGALESRIKRLLEELEASQGKIILFLDELHLLMKPGADGAADALKPALSRDRIRVIGATTLDEFRKIENDPAMVRRFTPITVKEPDSEATLEILERVSPGLERHHHLLITDEARHAAVELSNAHIADEFQPDKAITVLDRACAKAHEVGLSELGREQVAADVADRSGAPLALLLGDGASGLAEAEERVRRNLIGQDEAIATVFQAIRGASRGRRKRQKPQGAFLVCGAPGTGKTELAKQLADALGRGELVRFDLNNYSQEHEVANLLGAPVGYIGSEKGGQLSEAVRRNPACVILFDEAEKAHAKVTEALLQILGEGRVKDNSGREIDFTKAIIVLTSNVGVAPGAPVTEESVQQAAKQAFSPAFLSRVKLLVFGSPSLAQAVEVAELEISRIAEDLHEDHAIKLQVAPELVRKLTNDGFDPVGGLRSVLREVEALEELVDEALDNGAISEGDEVIAVLENGRPKLERA